MSPTPVRLPSHFDDEPPEDWSPRRPSITPSRIPRPSTSSIATTPTRASSSASSTQDQAADRPISPSTTAPAAPLSSLPTPSRASIAPPRPPISPARASISSQSGVARGSIALARPSISTPPRPSVSSGSGSDDPPSPPLLASLPSPTRASLSYTRSSTTTLARPSVSSITPTSGVRVLTGRPSFINRGSIAPASPISPARTLSTSALASAAAAAAGVGAPDPTPLQSPDLGDGRDRNDSIALSPHRPSVSAAVHGPPASRLPLLASRQGWPTRSPNASPGPTPPASLPASRRVSRQPSESGAPDSPDTPRKPLPAAIQAPYVVRRASSISQLRGTNATPPPAEQGGRAERSERREPQSWAADPSSPSPMRIRPSDLQRNESISSKASSEPDSPSRLGGASSFARATRQDSWSSLPDTIPTSALPSRAAAPAPAAPSAALLAPLGDRPALRTTESSEPLIRQTSSNESHTPSSPSRALAPSPASGGILEDPFIEQVPIRQIPSNESLRRGSLSSLSSDDNAEPTPLPPKIQINSLPTSPANPTAPTFTNLDASTLDVTTPGSQNTYQPSRPVSLARTTTGDSDFGPGLSASASAVEIKYGSAASRRSHRAQIPKSPRGKKRMERMTANGAKAPVLRKPFQSTRLKGEIYKPWLEKRDPAQRWARWITLTSFVLGFAIMGVLCYEGYASVPQLGNTCLILSDDFSSGTINPDYWTHEVRLDGYGHGEFEWTTDSSNNSFIQDGVLYLVPTLTTDVLSDAQIVNGYTLNLTADGTCTSTNVSQCVAVSNSSKLEIINPVRSARLTTVKSASMRAGRVEVVAKFPTGDWLWPQITMVSLNNTYGDWPKSGEIDILTARGNNASYPAHGVDYAQSELHWGPTVDLDREYMTWGYLQERRTYYNQEFHTYGLEWNDEYMWTFIDSRVDQVLSLRFNSESFWTRGQFPSTVTNMTTGDITKLTNPWIGSSNNNAPFDQPFYLVISLGVGSTDGWFPDGVGGKPWLDDSGTAMSDFWIAKDKWWDAWPSDPTVRGFAIKSVKMWKTC